MTVYASACINVHMLMYVSIYVCIYMCIYEWFNFSQNSSFFIFLKFLNKKFQQCTRMRHSKVHTSASTFYSHCHIYNVYLTYWQMYLMIDS